MKRIGAEVVGSLFWMGVGIFFAVGGIKLGLGTMRNPGPGFLPLVMSLILISFSLFVVGRALVRSELVVKGVHWRNQAVMIVAVFVYGWLLDFLGFLFSTFILMFALYGPLFEGKNRWLRVFLYAAVTALVGWLVFSVILEVPFPRARIAAIWR
jgi:hypothetical protein